MKQRTNSIRSGCPRAVRARRSGLRRGFFAAGALLATLAVVMLAASPTAAETQTEAMAKLIKAAAAEKQLTMLQGGRYGDTEFWDELEAAMNAKYGIKVDLQGTAGGPNMSQVTSRLLQEHKQG
ncbi:MAG: hypothetical protein OXU75_15290, partial [Deltaproteobacteria bacterium]|nr:hypothetical protein [Deltaproteobacteria bacterium]